MLPDRLSESPAGTNAQNLGQIPASIEDLTSVVEGLIKDVVVLQEKLLSVLGPETEDNEHVDDLARPAGICAIAEALLNQSGRLRLLSRHISTLIERIEL
jgi:hypothetical protein